MTIGALTSPEATRSLKRQPGLVPLAVAEPADPGRQALEGDPLPGAADPLVQPVVVGEQVEHRPVGGRDVRGSPDSAAQRNGPLPSQNSGRM